MKPTEIFKVLSDITRLRLYKLLVASGKSAAVCELKDAVGCTHYNASKHLKILLKTELINEHKNGRWVFYSVADTKDKFLIQLNKAIKTLTDGIYEQDLKRFKLRMGLRKNNKIQFCVSNKFFNKKI